MDLVLDAFDYLVGDSIYSGFNNGLSTLGNKTGLELISNLSSIDWLNRETLARQVISLFALTYAGIFVLYFGFALLSYYFMFDRNMEKHPKFLKDQIAQEIKLSMDSFVPVGLMTLPWFLGDVKGYSQLYLENGPNIGSIPYIRSLPAGLRTVLGLADGGNGGKIGAGLYILISAMGFILFTDYTIYWVHRMLHHPLLYKRLHKPHHRFIIPTPFASHAFHPLDGYMNSLPYHIYSYIIPVHKYLFLGLFVCVNLWTIFIHDSEMITDSPLEQYLQSPSHHTLHHLHFTVNYGQYFTYSDKWGGSFRLPAKGEDPMLTVIASEEKKVNALKSSQEDSGSSTGTESGSESDSGYESILEVKKNQ